jgi:hypothetical protein
MEFRSLAFYGLYLLAGYGVLRLGFGLQKRSRPPVFADFAHYLTAGVVFGLMDWLAPYLVAELLRDASPKILIRVLFIFGGLALPFLIAKIFFLLRLVLGWMGYGLRYPVKAGFAAFSLFLFLLFVLEAFEFFVHGRLPPPVHRSGNIFILGLAAPAIRKKLA